MNIQDKRTWQPVAIEAEQTVLGCLLSNPDAFDRISGVLEPQHFFDPLHRTIFEIISTLLSAGKIASIRTVPSFLPERIDNLNMTAKAYIARIALEALPPQVAVEYAKHVREMADRRRISEIATQMVPDAATDAAQLAAEAIEALDTIIVSNASAALPAASMANVMVRTVDKIAQAYANENKIVGIPTGLRDLDAKMGGMQRGNLVLLAGRPGMGKSAVALNFIRNSARKDYRTLMFSKEMPADELGERMISDYIFDLPCANLPYRFLRTGNFHEQLFEYVREAAEAHSRLPIDVEEQPGLTMSQIATRARRYKRKHRKLDILCIDHLGLIKPSERYRGNRVNEIMEITGGLKALAKELDCVVLLLSQLSREVEKREDKRPILADLRDSGSIEQDADTVIFLFREEYYLSSSEPRPGTPEHLEWQQKIEAAHNKLVAIIAKQRMGPTGSLDLFCDIGNNAIRDLGAGELP